MSNIARSAAPVSFSQSPPGATAGSTVQNTGLAAQQQQQLLIHKAQESQNQLQLEKQRVTLMLEINYDLMREIINLQTARETAKAAQANATAGESLAEELKTMDKNSNEYVSIS